MSQERIKRIRASWPDKVPCIVHYGDRTAKLIMPCEFTIAHLMTTRAAGSRRMGRAAP